MSFSINVYLHKAYVSHEEVYVCWVRGGIWPVWSSAVMAVLVMLMVLWWRVVVTFCLDEATRDSVQQRDERTIRRKNSTNERASPDILAIQFPIELNNGMTGWYLWRGGEGGAVYIVA